MSQQKTPLVVAISGAAGQIGYALIPLVASGRVFGSDQPVELRLLDIEPAMKALEGVVMEINDCAYQLVTGIVPTTDPDVAFKDVDAVFLVGGFPRKAGMDRKDLLGRNCSIFKVQGESLNKHAKRTVKVLVVANPANTNAWMAAHFAPDLPKTAFTALTRLDMNRAVSQLATKANVHVSDVKNVIIWGNHSKTQVPDIDHATILADGKEASATSVIGSDEKYLDDDFVPTVQNRGAAVIAARGLSSAMSAANAAADHMHDWVCGTKDGEYVSMGVWSDGSYGVAKDIIFSFPVSIKDGEYTVVQGLDMTDRVKGLIKTTEEELISERADALACVKDSK